MSTGVTSKTDIAKRNMVAMLLLLHDAMTALEDLLAVTPAKAPADDQLIDISERHAAAVAKARKVAGEIRRALK